MFSAIVIERNSVAREIEEFQNDRNLLSILGQVLPNVCIQGTLHHVLGHRDIYIYIYRSVIDKTEITCTQVGTFLVPLSCAEVWHGGNSSVSA